MRLFPFGGGKSSSRRRSYDDGGWISTNTKKAIAGVILILLAIITLLSFFSLAGPTGQGLLNSFRLAFGWVAYLMPFVLIFIGIELVWAGATRFTIGRWIGVALLVLGLLGTAHLVSSPVDESLQTATEGRGGGYLGFMLSYPLSVALSRIATTFIYIALLFVGVFLAFNISLADAWAMLKGLVPGQGEIEEGENEEDEAGDVEAPNFKVNTMAAPTGKPDVVRLKMQQQQEDQQKAKAKQLIKTANKAYKAPALDLLNSSVGRPDSGNIKENAAKIKRTLEHFGIMVQMGEVNVGPTVTQYTLRPEEGVKLSRITALQNDLALSLAAHPIRIEAPIPRKNLVGIEIPNKDVSLVRLRDLIASKESKAAESPLTMPLGKDVTGSTIVSTLEKMPHLLIAGATGSGKSVYINTMLVSLLYRNSPAILRMILVDPKRVELNVYDGIPHLLTPVIVDPSKTINALKWTVKEMDRRYQVLSESHARNLISYNTSNPQEAMPYIVVVIDELADIMAKYARDVEGAIVRLSQMARAVGIHLVLATQRPSVNVITGLIKANIPSRIAFHVTSQIDSRTILDMAGAEKLLGNGDMLYVSSEMGKPRRLQGAYISEEEVHRVVEAVKTNAEQEPEYDQTIVTSTRESSGFSDDAGEDDLFEEAKRVVVESGKASASLLQRRLRVGYARAARLLDMLEEQQIIGSGEGNKPREVLVRSEEADLAPVDPSSSVDDESEQDI